MKQKKYWKILEENVPETETNGKESFRKNWHRMTDPEALSLLGYWTAKLKRKLFKYLGTKSQSFKSAI